MTRYLLTAAMIVALFVSRPPIRPGTCSPLNPNQPCPAWGRPVAGPVLHR